MILFHLKQTMRKTDRDLKHSLGNSITPEEMEQVNQPVVGLLPSHFRHRYLYKQQGRNDGKFSS